MPPQPRRTRTTRRTRQLPPSPAKSVRITAPGDADEAAETARLRAQVIALQEQLAAEQARKDAEAEKQREEKARRKQELKARRKAEMERRGLDFDPGSPRTSEVGREDTEIIIRPTHEAGVEDGDDSDYDIVLDAALFVNIKKQCNKAFPIQTRSDCALSGVEQWVHEFMGAEDGLYSLSFTEYTIRRRICRYFSAGKRKLGKGEVDLDGFDVEQTELLLSRLDKLRHKHPDGDITVEVEIQVTCDRERVEKVRKDAQTATATATPVPTSNPQPPLTAPSESGGRVRAPVLSGQLRAQLDGEQYRESQDKIKDLWKCTSSSCINYNRYCWIDTTTQQHFAIHFPVLNLWTTAVVNQGALIDFPPAPALEAFQKNGPVKGEKEKEQKKPKLEAVMERQQEMLAMQMEMHNSERMMQIAERMSSSTALAPRRRYRSRSRSRSRGRHHSYYRSSKRRRSRSPPPLPSRPPPRSPHRHRGRDRSPSLPPPRPRPLRYHSPPPPPDPTTSSPFPSIGHRDDEIIDMALSWHIERQQEGSMKSRWRIARAQLLSNDWVLADCKALRDTTSEQYCAATTSMNMSLQIVREIPGLIDQYKDVYCDEMASQFESGREESRRVQDAARGLGMLSERN